MGDSGVHWMDIKLLPQPGLKPNQVIKAIGAAVKTGSKAAGGEAQHVFRVVGENRVIAVLNGGVTGALEAVNEVAEGCADITTVPTRTYERFAENVFGVDPAMTGSGGGIGDKGRVLWLDGVVNYKGLTQRQLLDTWKREFEVTLPGRARGESNFVLYKLAGKNEVHALFRTEDIDSWDDERWKLPIFVENGDQIETIVKSVDFL